MNATETAPASTELLTGTLVVSVKGEVISSNVEEFRQMVAAALATINRSPSTSAEFGQAEQDIKALRQAEANVRTCKEQALEQAASLHALFAALDETSEEIRAARLEIERQVTKRKEEIRAEYVAHALDSIHCDPIVARRHYATELENALKGKRTLESIAKALDVATKTINGRLAKSRDILDQFVRAHGSELIPDAEDLVIRSADHVEGELRRRLEQRRAAEERLRLEEEAAKANAAAAAARAEAEAAKAPVVEQDGPAEPVRLPDPPKIGSIPTGPTPAAEMAGFLAAVSAAFAPVKVARAALRHDCNRRRAEDFAEDLKSAWLRLKGQPEDPAQTTLQLEGGAR